MASATPKSAADIQGLEFDWLGSDEVGCVALFSTAGAGCAPAEFLRDTSAHDAAIEAVLALPASTTARFAPELAPGLPHTCMRSTAPRPALPTASSRRRPFRFG